MRQGKTGPAGLVCEADASGRVGWSGRPPATPGFGVLTSLLRVVASGSICPSFLKKTPGPFASDPVWLRLSAGECAQERAQLDPGTLIPLSGRLQYQGGYLG